MKIVIEHQPWMTQPYAVYYGERQANVARQPVRRFEAEADARAFCEAKVKGAAVIAEYEAPDGS